MPSPRRKSSAAREQQNCVNNLKQNRARNSCTASSGNVAGNAAGNGTWNVSGMKANSCSEDVCRSDRDNVTQVSELGGSVTSGGACISGADGTSVSDIPAVSVNGIVKDSPASDSELTVVPPRRRRLLAKDFTAAEDVRCLDVDKISSGKSSVEVESFSDSESFAVRRDECSFPQPRPRLSLLSASTSDRAEHVPSQTLSNDVSVGDDSVMPVDSTCPDTRSAETAKAGDIVRNGTSEEGRQHAGSLVEMERHRSEVRNDASSSVSLKPEEDSKVLVPSRAAPPPPLPKPKVAMHRSGSFEVVRACGDDVRPLDNGDSWTARSDLVATSVDSPLSPRNADKAASMGTAVAETSRNDCRPTGGETVGNGETSASEFASGRGPESDDSAPDVFYPSATPTIVLSASTADSSMAAAAEQHSVSGDGGCETDRPVPAVRVKKRLQLSGGGGQFAGLSRFADFHSSEKDSEDVGRRSCRAESTRSWSEAIVHGDDGGEGHAEVIPAQRRPYSLLHDVQSHEASDRLRRNSSPSCNVVGSSTKSNFPPARLGRGEMFVAETPPITPSAFGFDVADDDEETRTVSNSILFINQSIRGHILDSRNFPETFS